MAATNVKTTRSHVYGTERLAGGFGTVAAKQSDEQALRRLVMACLLWEDIAYLDGNGVSDQIAALVPKVAPESVAAMAREARFDQKLRHVPLLLCREMARYDTHKSLVADTLASVIHRPDELAEFLSLYWKTNDGKKFVANPVKRGLARAFQKFDEYQLAKWNRDGKDVKLRDVLFLCHAKPKDAAQDALWKRLIADELETPNTWEVGLSAAKSPEEKRAVWTQIITDGKLGALAFLKNMRNMQQAGVERSVIASGFANLRPSMLLPIDFMRAVQHAPDWTRQLEDAMFRCAAEFPKLTGWTIFVVDVSGSMDSALSSKTDFRRMDAAAAMCVLASKVCEQVSIYATAGSDGARRHQTEKVRPMHGFGLAYEIVRSAHRLGGGGIFTRQCLEYIQSQERETPDRIIVFSDSQDCDIVKSLPKPFGRRNYIVDVSAHKHGVNYAGVWTAEVSGWSEAFLRFIAAMEADGDSLQ